MNEMVSILGRDNDDFGNNVRILINDCIYIDFPKDDIAAAEVLVSNSKSAALLRENNEYQSNITEACANDLIFYYAVDAMLFSGSEATGYKQIKTSVCQEEIKESITEINKKYSTNFPTYAFGDMVDIVREYMNPSEAAAMKNNGKVLGLNSEVVVLGKTEAPEQLSSYPSI